jgi:hypothetical protein
MTSGRRAGIAALLIASLSGFARAELVENPMYLAWARFKPGARSVLSGTVSISALDSSTGEQPFKMNRSLTYELLEVTPEHVAIRMSEVVYINGRRSAYPPQRILYPAKAEKGTEGVISMDDGQPDTHRELKEITDGTDRIVFENKTAEATTREYSFILTQKDLPGPITMNIKEWCLPQVPGGVVKIESIGMAAIQTTTKMQLSEWYVPPQTPAAGAAPATRPAR